MAIIQSIREKYAKLAGVVIVIALLGFVLMDFGSGGGVASDTIAKVNGRKISYTEFENYVQQKEQEVRMQNPQMTMSELIRGQIRDQAWEDIINEGILKDLYKDLGITVSEAEMNDLLFGSNPDPMIRQAFTNPQTGQFNAQEAGQMIRQLRNDPEQKQMWENFENEIKKNRLEQKFNSLILGGLYMPKKLAEQNIALTEKLAAGELVMLPYSLISDNEIEISDEELKAYIQKNAKLYTNKQETRSIQYVNFEIIPSSEDTSNSIARMEEIREEFAQVQGDDLEEFLNLHQSSNVLPFTYFNEEQILPLDNGSIIWEAGVNEVTQPMFEGDEIWMSKIVEKLNMPKEVSTQHIFVASEIQGNTIISMEEAKATLDSAIAEINSGKTFAEVAQLVSDDNIAQQGGQYTFTPQDRSTIDPLFAKAVYNNPNGSKEIVKVESDDLKGYYYVEILERSAETDLYQKIAILNQAFDADKNTISDIYNQASKFGEGVLNGGDFEEVARDLNKNVLQSNGIVKHSQVIPGLGASAELGRWIQDAKVGDHSGIIDVDGQFVIAKLTDIQSKGLMQVNSSNREQIKALVLKEKKAEKLSQQYNSSNSLSEIAQKANQEIIAFDGVSFDRPFIPNVGQEPKVVGYVLNASNSGKVSKGIWGESGVIYVNPEIKSEKQQVGHSPSSLQSQFKQQYSQRALSTIIEQLSNKANIKDLRNKVYR